MWPFRHFGLKVVAIGLAVLLWLAVAGEETVERGLRVPLELQQLPAGVELSGEIPTAVDVRVRGASGTLSRIGPGDVVIIPPNTPHWFSEITSDQIVSLVVRVDPHKVLPAGYMPK